MSRLEFLARDNCSPEVELVSPLRHAADEAIVDLSSLGKLELRGELDGLVPAAGEQLLPLGPGRALLVVEGSPEAARRRLSAAGFRVYDVSAALAALEFEGEQLLARLSELVPAQLPASGAVARGTPALIEAREGGRFRLYVPQELGHYVAEVVADTARGLGR